MSNKMWWHTSCDDTLMILTQYSRLQFHDHNVSVYDLSKNTLPYKQNNRFISKTRLQNKTHKIQQTIQCEIITSFPEGCEGRVLLDLDLYSIAQAMTLKWIYAVLLFPPVYGSVIHPPFLPLSSHPETTPLSSIPPLPGPNREQRAHTQSITSSHRKVHG